MQQPTLLEDLMSRRHLFWAKVQLPDLIGSDVCWLWLASKERGYGIFGLYGGKSLGAHRVAWMLAHNQVIPKSMCVMHVCDNSLCVNPDHLRLGTQVDNINDMIKKGRAWWQSFQLVTSRRLRSVGN